MKEKARMIQNGKISRDAFQLRSFHLNWGLLKGRPPATLRVAWLCWLHHHLNQRMSCLLSIREPGNLPRLGSTRVFDGCARRVERKRGVGIGRRLLKMRLPAQSEFIPNSMHCMKRTCEEQLESSWLTYDKG